MTTLNHEVWANPTTPLFLQAGTAGNNVSPLIIKTADGTQQTAIIAQSLGGGTYTGGIYFAPTGGTPEQAYGGLQFFKNVGLEGWYLSVDGTPQIYGLSGGQGGTIVTQAPVYVSGVNEASTLELTSKSVGFQNNNASRITFEPTSITLGQQVVAENNVGLVVQTSNAVTASITSPSNVRFVTNSYITATTTYDFTAVVLPAPPNGYTSTDVVQDFVMSSSAPPIYASGCTYTNPAFSPAGVSTSGTTPSSGKAIWVGSTPNSIAKAMYIEFPPILAPVGTPVSVQWKQAGVYSFGAVYKNDALLDDITTDSSSIWISSTNYTFTSTGDDRIYIEINTEAMPPQVGYYYFNISDIAITTATPTQSNNGIMGMNGSTIQMSNAVSGSKVEARSSDGAVALTSSAGTGSSIVAGANIALTTTAGGSSINLNSPIVNLTNGGNISFTTSPTQMTINGGANQYLNLNAGSATITLTGNALYFLGTGANFNSCPVYLNSSSIIMNNNNLTGASNITTSNLDAVTGASNIIIGSNSGASFLYKLSIMQGLAGGATLSNIRYINNDAACATGIFHYLVSFDGTKAVSAPLPPKQVITGRNNNTFGSNYNGDSFTSSVGFTLPAYSVFNYSNIGSGVDNTFTNSNTIPYYFPDTGAGFSPSSSAQSYYLVPIVV